MDKIRTQRNCEKKNLELREIVGKNLGNCRKSSNKFRRLKNSWSCWEKILRRFKLPVKKSRMLEMSGKSLGYSREFLDDWNQSRMLKNTENVGKSLETLLGSWEKSGKMLLFQKNSCVFANCLHNILESLVNLMNMLMRGRVPGSLKNAGENTLKISLKIL